jgi:hypothetical protein
LSVRMKKPSVSIQDGGLLVDAAGAEQDEAVEATLGEPLLDRRVPPPVNRHAEALPDRHLVRGEHGLPQDVLDSWTMDMVHSWTRNRRNRRFTPRD